jgi:glycosyltransferase involved in cell wall biosynthesis
VTAPEITVAVPVKDRREQMLRCLDSLLAQDHPAYEVLILDNGSTDGTAEACEERAASATIPVRVERVPGVLGAVRNRAGELAATEFLAFTDSDCIADRGWLTALARALREAPAVGVVCGATRPEEPVTAGWAATIEVDHFTGRFESCNIGFRREAFRRSAGFDEQVGHFWEDTAAGYAMLRDGWEAAFAPDAVVCHDVTYPGYAWYLRRALKASNLGPVLRQYPEIAEDLFYRRTFVHRRDALLLLALAGIGAAVARRSPLPLAVAAPYARERLRQWRDPKGLVQIVLYDGACVIAAARGSVAAGRVVL